MARTSSPPFELELVPLLITDGGTATSLTVVLEGASGLTVTLEPLTLPKLRVTFAGLEIAGAPTGQADPGFELYDEVPVVPGAEGFGLATALGPTPCCARLVARFDSVGEVAGVDRALVRVRLQIVGTDTAPADVKLRLGGVNYRLGPWPRLDLRDAPTSPYPAPMGGLLFAALQRLRARQ